MKEAFVGLFGIVFIVTGLSLLDKFFLWINSNISVWGLVAIICFSFISIALLVNDEKKKEKPQPVQQRKTERKVAPEFSPIVEDAIDV